MSPNESLENKKKFKLSKSFFVVVGIILFIFFLVLSYFLGFKLAIKKYLKNDVILERGFSNKDFSLLWETIDLIKSRHINKNQVSDKKILYGAIQGVLNSLDDPYTNFFDPEDAKKFMEDVNGSFGGIGAEISIRKNQLIIVAPLKNTPAEKAGLKPGDKILKVNDKETFNMTIDEAVKMIRGEPNTQVKLLILRDEWEKPKEFNITRDIINVPTLDWEIKEDILYVKLHNFNNNAEQLLAKAVIEAYFKNVKGMILDLRNNPGGFLDVAIRISGWFLKRGEIVTKERFYNGEVKELRANNNEALVNLPLVVLINSGSASASEILAGALKENKNVKIIGEKSFGKGTVQELVNLKDGSVIKISIAEWLTPKGNSIEKIGIQPDIEVTVTEKDIEKNRDPQLEKAMEEIKKLIKN